MPKNIKEFILFFSYLPVLAFGSAVALARLLVYAQAISIQEFGACSLVLVISTTFYIFGGLGYQHLVTRLVPVLQARGRGRRAVLEVLRASIAGVFSAVVFELVVLGASSQFDLDIIAITLGILHGLLSYVSLVVDVEIRNRAGMQPYSWIVLGRAFATALGGVAGALIAHTGAAVIVGELIVMTVFVPVTFSSMFRSSGFGLFSAICLLYRKGLFTDRNSAFHVFHGGISGFASLNFDRWIASALMDQKTFGVYAFAWIPMQISQNVQFLITSSVTPVLALSYSERRFKFGMNAICLLSFGSLILSVLLLLFIYPASEKIVVMFFPAYSICLPFLHTLELASAIRLSDFWIYYLIAYHADRSIGLVRVVGFSAAFAIWLLYANAWMGAWSGQGLATFALLNAACTFGVGCIFTYTHHRGLVRTS